MINMNKITLYTNPYSRGAYVRWMLEECGAEYEVAPLRFGKEMKSEEYLKINPMGKVPALEVNDTVITETAAILMFLGEQFPDKKLIPSPDSLERGELYRWMFFAIHLEYAVKDKLSGKVISDEEKMRTGYGDFDTAVNTLTEHLKDRKYIVGNSFTLADLYFSGLISFLFPEDKALSAYMKTHTSRPAYIRASELDSGLAREMGL